MVAGGMTWRALVWWYLTHLREGVAMMGPQPGWQPTPGAGRPPGWGPDPTGRYEERFFDGHNWTARVRMGGSEAIEREVETGSGTGRWFPDPTGRFKERLFDRGRWTKIVRVAGTEAIDIQGVPSATTRPRGQAPTPTSATQPPGWYVDPSGEYPQGERFWDGYQWTAKARPGRVRGRSSPYARAVIAAGAAAVVILLIAIVALIALL